MARGIEYAERHHLPFIPLDTYASTAADAMPGYVGIRWQCKNLTPEGRCGDYENRPNLCRIYEPGEDRLCAVYIEPITKDKL